MIANIVRRIVRSVALVATVAGAFLFAGAGAASATPADWPKADPVSGLDYIVLLVLIPVGVAAAVAFLAWFPSLVKAGRESTTEIAPRSED